MQEFLRQLWLVAIARPDPYQLWPWRPSRRRALVFDAGLGGVDGNNDAPPCAGEFGPLIVLSLWRKTRTNSKRTSPVRHEGFIYALDEEILGCSSANIEEMAAIDLRR